MQQQFKLSTLVLSTYTQALLIARSKGMRGQDAKMVAVKVTATSITKKVGYPVDAAEVLRIIGDDGDDGDDGGVEAA